MNGFTTLDLIKRELPYLERLKPELVTILIGVNDLVQGRSPADYKASLATIYDRVAALSLPPGRAATVSIPNWSVVPAARGFGVPEDLRLLTDAFNDIARVEAEARGLTWIDITAASISGLGSAGWIAADDLHPGDPQYRIWAEAIWASLKGSWA